MADTLKIPRPLFPRRHPDAGGRVEHDARGNAIWVRSRATDSIEIHTASTLAIVEDAPYSYDRGRLTGQKLCVPRSRGRAVLSERRFERSPGR
jgi:hypothetical protein